MRSKASLPAKIASNEQANVARVRNAIDAWPELGSEGIGNSLSSYLEIPLIHKRLVITSFLICLILGWVALLVWPRKYESEVKLKILVGRESVSLDPTATTSQTLMLQKTQDEEIASALEVLGSRSVFEKVVEELGEATVLDGEMPGSGAEESSFKQWVASSKSAVSDTLHSLLLAAGFKDDISDRELAVRELQDTVSIYAPKKSSVITLNVESKSAAAAQKIAETVTQSFMQQHLKISRTDGSQEFFLEQSETQQAKLEQLHAARSQYLQERNIVSIDANRELLKEQLANIDRDLLNARGELEKVNAEIQDLQKKVEEEEDEIVSQRNEASDQTWSGMRQRVYDLELAERELSAKLTDTHPRLIQVREQLDGARKILDELKEDRVDQSTTPNPMKDKLREALKLQQTAAVGLNSMIEEKVAQRKDAEAKVDELLEHERELTLKEREIGLAESSLGELRDKLEEARVIDELQADRISNVKVFQPATFVERAVSPEKKILFLGFAALGCFSGLGLAFLRQSTTSRIRVTSDVERLLGSDVLAEIPRVKNFKAMSLADRRQFDRWCQSIVGDVLLARSSRERRGSADHAAGHERLGHTIGVLGIDEGCGATTLAANLAKASHDDCNLKTLLVDADTRSRSLSKMFGLNGKPGLAELLGGDASHDECVQSSSDSAMELMSSSADNFEGRFNAGGGEITQALEAYRDQFDIIMIDLAPASLPDQSMTLAQFLDCVIVVVESEKTDVAIAERLMKRLYQSDAEVLGVVVNKRATYLPQWVRRIVG